MEKDSSDGILEEFRLEFLTCWRRLPNKGLFLILFAVWLGLFHLLGNSNTGVIKSHSLLTWIYMVCKPNNTLERDDTQGLLAPFIVLGLFWWKRKELLANELQTWLPGVLLVGFGLLIHLLGFRVQQPRISIVGLLTGIYGLMGLAWGPGWLRKSFFPFCLLVFCIPLGTLSQPITFRLRMLVSQLVEVISHYVLMIDIVRDGAVLADPTNHYQYVVAPACSGIRSLITTIGLALIYGTLTFRTWWKRGVVFASAIPLAIIGNTMRMAMIILAADNWGQEWGNKIHEGWPFGISNLLPYLVVFAGLILLGRWLPAERETAPAEASETKTSVRAESNRMIPATWLAAGVTMALILGAGALLFRLQGDQKLAAPGVKTAPLAGTGNLEVLLPEQVLDWASEKLPVDDVVLSYLPADTSYGCRRYTAPDGNAIQVNAVLMGADRTSIHKPQICLYAQGWQLDPTPAPVKVTMDRPYPYDLSVIKLTASKEVLQDGQKVTGRIVYVYWYVADGSLSADPSGFERMWLMGRDLLRAGTLQRWAYVSYSSVCLPGAEEATFERIKKLMVASVPEFQLTPARQDAMKVSGR